DGGMSTEVLTLERRAQDASSGNVAPGIQMTPAIGKDYWSYRVRLSDRQAVIGFPKFGTIGIGFAVEDEDWNANLPFTVDAAEIAETIAHNKGDATVADRAVLRALEMVREAAAEDRLRDAVVRALCVVDTIDAGGTVDLGMVREMALDLRRIGRTAGVLDA